MKLYGDALTAGVTLQVLACLMNGYNRASLLQTGLGLVGVLLMLIGFHHWTSQ